MKLVCNFVDSFQRFKAELYLETCQTTNLEFLQKQLTAQPLTIFAKIATA